MDNHKLKLYVCTAALWVPCRGRHQGAVITGEKEEGRQTHFAPKPRTQPRAWPLPSPPRRGRGLLCRPRTQPCSRAARGANHVSLLRIGDATPRVPRHCSGRFWCVPKSHASPGAAAAAALRAAARSSLPQVGTAAHAWPRTIPSPGSCQQMPFPSIHRTAKRDRRSPGSVTLPALERL